MAVAAVMAPKAKVLRDGIVTAIDAINLVPGDVIVLHMGNQVHADVKFVVKGDSANLQVLDHHLPSVGSVTDL